MKPKRNWQKIVSILTVILITVFFIPIFVRKILAASSWAESNWSGGNFSSSSNIATSTPNQLTLFKENFTNTGFESDLTSWNTGAYTLNDQFTTDRNTGAVNGTSAEPTGGTRTVTDSPTPKKISITGSVLNFATGETINDGLWYSSLARAAGKTLIQKVTPSDTNGIINVGWDTDTSGAINDQLVFAASGVLQIVPNGGTAITVGTYTANTYYVAGVMRTTPAAGFYWYIKGGTFTNWTLLWITAAGTAAGVPAINVGSTTSIFTADDIKVPAATWLPTPLAYDTFTTNGSTSTETTGPDGQTTPSLSWTGSTWTAAGGSMSNIPAIGDEKITNSGMETGDPPSSWTIDGSPSTTQRSNEQANSGSYSYKIVSTTTSDGIHQDINAAHLGTPLGTWHQLSGSLFVTSGSARLSDSWTGVNCGATVTATSVWTPCLITYRRSGTGVTAMAVAKTAASTFYVDDFSLKPLTLSSLFRTLNTTGTAGVIADVNVTVTAGTQAGLVLNLDSTLTPSNFRLVYTDGTNIYIDDVAGGTYTNKQTTAHGSGTLKYTAGATLRAVDDGTSLTVYYNNAKVGNTITDMAANTNTNHGLFSAYSSNSFDNFTLWPRSGYAVPDTDITATRDTNIKYAGTASVKLVAPANDTNFTENINLGDTNSYNLSAYAYTDGSAVTSSDISLYNDTGAIATNYTSVGGGWYQLSATITGIASSKAYGVTVKAGKTVYVDNMSLNNAPSSGTLTSSIFDTGINSLGTDYGTLTYSATTPINTSASVKVRGGNSADLSDAQAFSNCSAITSGTNLANSSCVTNGRYIQYQVTLTSTNSLTTPTFNSININFSLHQPSVGAPSCSDSPPSSAPVITSVNPLGRTSLDITFTKAGSPVSYYALEYGDKSGNYKYGAANIGGSNATSYTVSALSPQTTYFFRVRAGNGCATGAWSTEAIGTTGSAVPVLPTPTNQTVPLAVPPPTTPTPAPQPTPSSGPGPGAGPNPPQKPQGLKLFLNTRPITDFVQNSLTKFASFGRNLMAGLKRQVKLAGINIQRFATVISGRTNLALTGIPTATDNAVRIAINSVQKTSLAFSDRINFTLGIAKNNLQKAGEVAFGSIQNTGLAITDNLTAINSKTREISQQGLKEVSQLAVQTSSNLARTNNFIAKNTAVTGKKIAEGFAVPFEAITESVGGATNKIQAFIAITDEYWFSREPTEILSVKIEKVSSTSALVTWQTNNYATSAVNYGFDTSYGHRIQTSEKVKDHKIELTDLAPDKTYFFEVMSQDKNFVYDSYYTFTTPADGSQNQVELLKKPNVEIIGNSGDWIITRNAPTKEGGVTGKVQVGQSFQLLMEENGWNLIKINDSEGWISGEFSKLIK